MELRELIERLKTATAPDRALGNDILFATGWDMSDSGEGPDRIQVWVDPEGIGCLDGDQPDPTSSLDMALSLVPEGAAWFVQSATFAFQADVRKGGKVFDALGSTAAIALTTAALKARQHARQDKT